MKFLTKLFSRLRKRSDTPIPAVVRKLAQPGYTDNASVEQLTADHAACRDLRQFVRKNFSEQEYLRYLRVLDDLESLIEAKQKFDIGRTAEQVALDRLNAAYESQQRAFVN